MVVMWICIYIYKIIAAVNCIIITSHGYVYVQNCSSDYSWCNQVLWLLQMVWKNTSRRWDLHLEVEPPIRGWTSIWKWDLQSEVEPSIGGETSIWRWDPPEVGPPVGGETLIGGETSIWRWDLQLAVRPSFGGRTPIRGGTSNCRWDSDWRWDLHLDMRPPNGGLNSNWRLFLFLLVKRWDVFLFALIFIVCKPLFTWCSYTCI